MSYPYGGPPGGYPAPGGYPTQVGYPGATGGYPGAAPSYPGAPPSAPGGYGVSMPTPETAMTAAYDSSAYGAGGLPYAPQPGIGFNMGDPAGGMGAQPMQMPGAPGYPAQPGYPSAPGGYGGMPPAGGGYLGSAAPPMGGYPGAGGPPGGMPSAPQPYQAQNQGPPGGYTASAPAYQPSSQPAYNTQAGYPQLTTQGQQAYNNYQQPSHTSAPSASHFPTSSVNSQYNYVEKCQGTLKPYPSFSPEDDAKKLRKAMKGLGTDEKAIIDILAYRSNAQRQQIKGLYKTCFGKDLMNDLRSELGGRFEDLILALMLKPEEYDAQELRRSMAGVGTDEDCLIEILCSRTNKEIHVISTAYRARYGKNLEKDIISDTSGHFKRLMVSLANGGRMENQTVDLNKARADAQNLYQAGEKRWGTDESQFNAILASQSFAQLRAVFDEYQKLTGKDIERSIVSEMSGDLAKGMLSIVRVVRNKHNYFCDKLYHSMKGMGTDDRTLIRIIVTRAEVDMVQIKELFQKKYGQSLEKFIRDDTSGDYRRALLALIGGGTF